MSWMSPPAPPVFSSEAAGGIELEHRHVGVGICVFGLWKEHYQIQDRVEVNDSALCFPRFYSVNHAELFRECVYLLIRRQFTHYGSVMIYFHQTKNCIPCSHEIVFQNCSKTCSMIPIFERNMIRSPYRRARIVFGEIGEITASLCEISCQGLT